MSGSTSGWLDRYLTAYNGGGEKLGYSFINYLAQTSAALDVTVRADHGDITLQAPARHLERMINALALIVVEPSFSNPVFERQREAMEKALVRESFDPMSDASSRLAGLVYGWSHPYGHPAFGTAETLRRIELPDVEAHHHRIFRPERSAVIVLGDAGFDAVFRLVKRAFGRWKSRGEAAPLTVPRPRASARRDVIIVHRANMSQTLVCAGRALDPVEPDEARALEVANLIFGGQVGSRLHERMREQQGYTYGADSRIEWRRNGGQFSVCSRVERDATAQAVRDLIDELERMGSEPADADAMERARGRMRSRAIYQFETV